jgi:hypothetical protein
VDAGKRGLFYSPTYSSEIVSAALRKARINLLLPSSPKKEAVPKHRQVKGGNV